MRDRPWWQDAIGYQVYLPSFQDSDGDGWGDLPGLISRLDHLRDLGVTLLWISPFHPSPMRDHGYDVADYRAVDPRYGTLSDLDKLLCAAHERGIRVVADLVVNHTSSEHPWFRSARRSRTDPLRDRYIWRDPAPDGGPPNNWLAHFGGPAWTFDERTGQYYLHLFTPHQPDLNWDNPEVADEVDDILRFWFDRGLDGFRIDTAHYLTKHPGLPDNPWLAPEDVPSQGGVAAEWLRQDHRYDIEQPSAMDIHRRWRAIADSYHAVLIGEVYILDPARLATYVEADGLHSTFWFGLVESGWAPERVVTALRAAAAASPTLAWVQSSHDRKRAVTRYGSARRAIAVATLLMGLPGIPFLYNGEELGLPDGTVPRGRSQDPLAAADGGSQSRDGARTPMPWEPGPGLGFTTASAAWLPFGDRSPSDTVAVQREDPDSPLSIHRRLIAARARTASCRAAPLWLDHTGDVLGYRTGPVVVAANLSERPHPFDPGPGRWRCEFDTDDPAAGRVPAELAPGQAVIVIAGEAVTANRPDRPS
ncbi:alpha-glucosidase AglA [Amycolatopsis deserti]|uniref:Alpha-glucosidase AglA n=1 Tax=Amycolatopsis deserti TaxID=185696 RepID=A0ABQ3JAX2_9PSEU|nr:alpha-amylase family glycosyl hydrolase [Amycolatopsis deserti]GHF04792.1 alpha-glucosidase AglA [Amycolatopsis deserti]